MALAVNQSCFVSVIPTLHQPPPRPPFPLCQNCLTHLIVLGCGHTTRLVLKRIIHQGF